MNVSFFIARRYLFSKKSHNAINVISIISVIGICIATMAMVCVLSVFNGFAGIIENQFNSFDPDLKITPAKGKVFDYNTETFNKALQTKGIDFISESLEENALIKYDERQVPILVKGVSEDFKLITDIDNLIIDGEFKLSEDGVNYAILGSDLAITLSVRAGFVNPVEIYAPKRDVSVNLANPTNAFSFDYLYIAGVYSLNQQGHDNLVAIIPIEVARELFRYENEVSSISIKLKPSASVKDVKAELKRILGNDFLVEDRYEQQKESFRMIQIEKWVTFLILAFILLIAVFNVVGSLSMLIVEKKEDIVSLQNMGASNRLITRIFLYEGWMITFIGIISGIVIGLTICLLQQHYGFIKLGASGTYIIDAYPVIVKFWDIITVFVVVSIFSLLTILYPIRNLRKNLNTKTNNIINKI